MAARTARWRALSLRILAASVGGYVVCYTWICALIAVLPMDGVDATILATGLAFMLFTAIVLRAFAIGSVVRLWLEIVVATLVPAAVATVALV